MTEISSSFKNFALRNNMCLACSTIILVLLTLTVSLCHDLLLTLLHSLLLKSDLFLVLLWLRIEGVIHTCVHLLVLLTSIKTVLVQIFSCLYRIIKTRQQVSIKTDWVKLSFYWWILVGRWLTSCTVEWAIWHTNPVSSSSSTTWLCPLRLRNSVSDRVVLLKLRTCSTLVLIHFHLKYNSNEKF